MTKNKDSVKVISLSIPKKILAELESMKDNMGYSSRSELFRDAVRNLLMQKKQLDNVNGYIEGVIVLLYDHPADGQVSEVRHRFMKTFKSFMHSDFKIENCSCCEVLMFSGIASAVRKAYYELKSIKGVEEANIYIASR